MSGKCRPSLRAKTLENVKRSNLSQTDKNCIDRVFRLVDVQREEIENLREMLINLREHYYRGEKYL